MKVLYFLSLLNVCYGQKIDSMKHQKDTSKVEFTITTYGIKGNLIRQYTDSILVGGDTMFFIKPKID